ncbi:hypothetical protein E1J38_003975 [Seonamhaeicola sediminis]|uniref:Uncharacterized protein n=1 Tax=Seonamhaeicola sediminis TaxID=2528206 RepID=A0A562YGK4_9FLAO|nr:hypothetical protein [Seonamhaeicola sediminis]TWO33942.1 hypothetical protein E1J38_003975 [Seonamhaeicola sediminis]
MKNLLFVLISLILFSCGNKTNKKNHSIIGMEFQKFKEIERFSNYSKISDTVVYGNYSEPKHGILHLRNKKINLIIFKSINFDSENENRIFRILDTLVIPKLNKHEVITIGYCQRNDNNNENLIAIVEKTDSLKIRNIRKVWTANTNTNKIEIVNNLNRINCFNEWFSK